MNLRNLVRLVAYLWLPAASVFAQAQVLLTIVADEDPQTPADYRLVWPTMPGQRYEVRQSSDLQTWEVVPGFPVVATGSTLELPFLAGNAPRFFHVLALDDLPSVPSGMAYIPGGIFQMGDTFGEVTNAMPVHSVYVSPFFMDKFEVNRELWLEVYTWALGNGYSFANVGESKGNGHPVHTISWHDAAKWCNARSDKAGLTPCYYTDADQTSVYRSGTANLVNANVKWTANGFRLATEAEWEKAARGGEHGRRFPWGDTLTHSQANYNSRTDDAYDLSPTREWHPAYNTGDASYPFTSPVGSFPPNDYGVHDMSGNVLEWCWDWWDRAFYGKPAASLDDPHGPSNAASARVVRGGAWNYFGRDLQVASRFPVPPFAAAFNYGFRCVRRL